MQQTTVSEVAQKGVVPALEGPIASGALPTLGRVQLYGAVDQTLITPVRESEGTNAVAGHLVAKRTILTGFEFRPSPRVALGVRGSWHSSNDVQGTIQSLNDSALGPTNSFWLKLHSRVRLLGDDTTFLALELSAGGGNVVMARRIDTEQTGSYTVYDDGSRGHSSGNGSVTTGQKLSPQTWKWDTNSTSVEWKEISTFVVGAGLQGYHRFASHVGIAGGGLIRSVPYIVNFTRVEENCSGFTGSGGNVTCSGQTAGDVPWLRSALLKTFWFGLDYTWSSMTVYANLWLHAGDDTSRIASTQPGGGQFGLRLQL